MKNEDAEKMYLLPSTIILDWDDDDESLDDNWLVSASDLFNGFEDFED